MSRDRAHFSSLVTHYFPEPSRLVAVLGILAVLVVLVLYPVGRVLGESFQVGGEWSLRRYADLLGSTYLLHTVANTLLVGVLATAASLLLGLVFAYGIVRAAIPGRAVFRLIAVLPLVTPPFFVAFAFILLFGRQGLVNQVLFELFGVRWVIYGWQGVVLAETITQFPIAFLSLAAALGAIDARLEEAADDLGAGFWSVLTRITLPLLAPALLSSALLVFMFVLSSFGVPALLAGSGLFFPDATMLAPEVITQILGRGDLGAGAALATIMLVPSFGLFVFQDWYVRNRSFVTVTGAPGSFEPRPMPAGVRWACFTVCALVSLLILGLYAVIAAGAITRTWGVNYSLTGQHLQLMLSVGAESIRNSLVLSAAGALLATIFGTLAAYVLTRWQFPGARTLDFVAMLPYALPGVVMGLGYAAGFNVGLIVLTGTWAIILLNYAIRRFPFAVQGGKAALAQIDRSLEEAAADLGASWLHTFWRVTLPLLRTTFVAGVTFSFIKAMTDITAVIFLVSPHWRLMSVDVYNYITAGRLGVAAAMSTLMVLLILGFLVALWRLTGLGYNLLKD